jgi:5'-nucleotidase
LPKDGHEIKWDVAFKYGCEIFETIIKKFFAPPTVLLNVNFPAVASVEDIRGIKITRQGFRAAENHVIKSKDPRGEEYFWLGGAEYRKNDMTDQLETDLGAVNYNFISITPVSVDFTASSVIGNLQEIFE